MSNSSTEHVITTTCAAHCGGGCPLKVHVKDGVITRIEADDDDKKTQVRACLRGRSWRQRIYHPDRLKQPMRRVGPRESGQFKPISWDEALDTIASEIKRIKDTHGPASIIHWVSGGDQGMLHDTWRRMSRLFCMMDGGGYTRPWGLHSYEAGIFAELTCFGMGWTAHTRDDFLNSKLIIMWGWDPSTTIQDTNTAWYLTQAKEAGVKIISVDPRFTVSTATYANHWIPIRPGSDTAMLVAMANVMVTENLHDQAFLDKYTVGFDAFKDYILGNEDGVAKTPEWASEITGIPADTIRKLAREYATAKPAALITGIGPGRTAYGEQYHRVAITLAAMTGNIGKPGGSCGGKSWGPHALGRMGSGPKIPSNPVDQTVPNPEGKLPNRNHYIYGYGIINVFRITDAIIKGKAGGYSADYKMLWITNANPLNQWPNTNKTVEAFNKLDLVVTEEQFMTPTAQYADIVLPSTTFFERADITMGAAVPVFYAYRDKIIEPIGEARTPMDVATELAGRLGLEGFNDKTDEEWLDVILEKSTVPDHEAIKKDGIYKIDLPEPNIPFRAQIEDPENNPFYTPSGKIEIYSQTIADMNMPDCPPIPKYVESWESPNDPLAEKYPLQLITTHTRRRAHTQFDNVPWLRELDPHSIKTNSVDADARGIKNGDMVKVFNDRGTMIIPVKIVEIIMPGVVDLPQGAWFDPDENGIDRGGCANVLSIDRPSPGGALPSNTGLVQIEKA